MFGRENRHLGSVVARFHVFGRLSVKAKLFVRTKFSLHGARAKSQPPSLVPSDIPPIRGRRKVEISPEGWDSLIDAPPVFAVKLTRKPTAYANQRMLRIP